MEDFAGRMTAVGWLVVKHCDRISQVTTNPVSDRAKLDVEVMVLWAFLKKKLEKNDTFGKEWPKLVDSLEGLRSGASKDNREATTEDVAAGGQDTEGDRLTIRLLQLELLVSCAVEEGVLDVATLPHDDRRKRSS